VLLLGWGLLERFVQADVAIRTSVIAGVPPVTALVLVALVVALAILMKRTVHALLCTLPSPGVHSDALRLDDQPGPGFLSLVLSAPVGGTGPRAPGGHRRRPVSLHAAL
jgi:hypothetical protein